MLAVSYRGPYRLRVEEKAPPRIEHPQDIILRVTRAAICGSDLHLYHGLVPDTRVGSTFGHEFTGVVEEIGPAVEKLEVGDRVLVPFHISCGSCFFCQRSLFASCENTNPSSSVLGGVYGYSHTTGGYEGGQAELVRVPFADVGPMKIPEDMEDEDVLLLTDVIPTGYQAAEMGGIREEDTVVVLGCGPVGLATQRAAWLMGAARVIGVDRVPERLEMARRWAQSEVLDFSELEDPVARIKEITDGRGADVCIDAVGLEASGSTAQRFLGIGLKVQAGAATAAEWAIEATRRGGTVVLIGVYGPPWNLVPIGTAMNKGLTMRMGQCHVRRYLPKLLDHVRAGRIDARALISHRFPLVEAPEAYRMFARKQDGCIKAVLIPGGHA